MRTPAERLADAVSGRPRFVLFWKERSLAPGCLAKFTQNSELRGYLASTGDRVLVEASPLDRVWGIGLAADDDRARSPARWRGSNLLGFALMEVRERL